MIKTFENCSPEYHDHLLFYFFDFAVYDSGYL